MQEEDKNEDDASSTDSETSNIAPIQEFSEDEYTDIHEMCMNIMESYVHENPTAIIYESFIASFTKDVTSSIYEMLCIYTHENEINSHFEDAINGIIENAFHDFHHTYYPYRSGGSAEQHVNHISFPELKAQIEHLINAEQGEQRSDDWDLKRKKSLTASNLYKIFGSHATRNSLIYEKCTPHIKSSTQLFTSPNINTPMQWGVKYEPVTLMIYEYRNNTRVGEFGCITHPEHLFLAASPDGINIDENSPLFGRMIEIKNPYSRKITGEPKMEYWVQTQMQMEVCKLDTCDFVETIFSEYPTYQEYVNDAPTHPMEETGIIMYFQLRTGATKYIYKPINITSPENIEKWECEQFKQMEYQDALWIKNIYWKLETYSCTLILRNRTWFASNFDAIRQTWDDILHDREHGYDHRQPMRRLPKPQENITDYFSPSQQCLISVVKLGADTNEIDDGDS